MECALWLNKKKIFKADEISDNFDIAAIRGYFLGRSLVKWLSANGGEIYAEALSGISPDAPNLNDLLTEIFTGVKKNTVPTHSADDNLIIAVDRLRGVPTDGSFAAASGMASSFNSELLGSFKWSSFSNFGSFGPFSYGSFGKFSEWEWEWALGSFRKVSGSFGGFGSYSFNFGGAGSFNFGSFNYSSFPWNYDKLGSFADGSFAFPNADEYDEIMYRTLGLCPLNRYGYGIHLI